MLHGKIQTHLAADYPNGAPDMVRLNDLRQGDAPLLDEVEQDWLRRQGLLNQSPNPVLSLKALAELANGTGRSSLGQVAGR